MHEAFARTPDASVSVLAIFASDCEENTFGTFEGGYHFWMRDDVRQPPSPSPGTSSFKLGGPGEAGGTGPSPADAVATALATDPTPERKMQS